MFAFVKVSFNEFNNFFIILISFVVYYSSWSCWMQTFDYKLYDHWSLHGLVFETWCQSILVSNQTL